MQFVQEHGALIFGVLWAMSELLAAIPGVQSNSIFQLVMNVLKALKPQA